MSYFYIFWGLWLWRYVRLMVNLVSYLLLRPIPPAAKPRFTEKDVTVVIPTLGTSEDLKRCLSTIKACLAHAIILVTPQKNVAILQEMCQDLGLKNTGVLGAPKANKRMQMIQGLREVTTNVIVFADDDVFWPSDFLVHMLAPFEDLMVGAVGPFNALERPTSPNGWDFLNAAYLKRWEWEVGATSNIDGGIACLSGRTMAIQTKIVQDPAFINAFFSEKWFGVVGLMAADDDSFITRWLVNRGWKIKIQCGTSLTTTLDGNWKFVQQCLRWSRTTWRSNITSLLADGVIWKEQPYCVYALHLSMLNPPSFVYDPLMWYCLARWLNEELLDTRPPDKVIALGLLFLWLAFAKTVKLWGHFNQYPSDLKYIPLATAFGYFHGLVKVAAFLTIGKTSWGGSRSSTVEAHSAHGATAVLSVTKVLGTTMAHTGAKATDKSGLKSIKCKYQFERS